MRGNTWTGSSRAVIFAFFSLAMLAACSESKVDDGVFDTSRLPRVSGGKEIFASPAVTHFTSPNSVGQTADTLEKSLAALGWQKYVPPLTSVNVDPNLRQMTLKKGSQALSVFITVTPVQNNAAQSGTANVQYSGVPLKTDLPFTKDATDIEYSPERPVLTLLTAEPVDKTLEFYRKELGDRGWSLWSKKLDARQPAGGPSGEVRERIGSAQYVSDKEPSVALVLTMQPAEAGKFKVELKEWPIGILASLRQAYLNGGNNAVDPVDVSKLPRLEGANIDTSKSSPARLSYTVPGPAENAIVAVKAMLAADGWQEYSAPLEKPYALSLNLKKGQQGLWVSFTRPPGQTGIDYSPTRLPFALPFPADATDIVFDYNRPYLSCITTGPLDAARDFFQKELAASGWTPLTPEGASKRWPNATFTEIGSGGVRAYYISDNLRPIMLSLQPRGDGKIDAEIRVPAFAQVQTLEADTDVFGLPRPKSSKTSGGTGGDVVREAHAHVIAEISTVLAFYRRELAARNWTEDSQGAVLNPDEVSLGFTSPTNGTAVLKLTHKYDMTIASLVQQLPKAAAKPEAAANDNSIDALMKQAQQMVREATKDAPSGMKAPKATPSADEPAETLRTRASNDAPVPLPDTAEDIEVSSERLEFNSASSVKSVAEFYRAAMKQRGWQSQTSVINQANMVVLNFSKVRESVSFTILRMGSKTNVTANGSGLKVAGTKPAAVDASQSPMPAAVPVVKATEDDLLSEESGGLPVPKRHTLSNGTKTPFRRDLQASVPLELNDVLGFYRRELSKLGWKEESSAAAVTPNTSVIAYSSADGPALLTLGRKDNETTVSLVVKNPDAATKAGVIPKAGQARILVSNPNEVEASITIDNQTAKVAPGGGMKGPDGAIIDLSPGKYKYSVKLSGQPARNDELEVSADQTWGVVIGPGGALPLLVY